MEETQTHNKPNKDNAIVFYILGGVIITAIIVAGFLFYPRNSTPETTGQENQPVLGEQATAPTATAAPKGPIGSLACTSQYYNTVNGVTETYYISADGEAPAAAGQVTCTITAAVNNQIVATDTVTPAMSPATERGGVTFKCSSQGLKLKPNVPTKVTYDLKDANGVTASCSRTFLLPG